MVLSDRQLLLLQVIIDDFIRSAQPIGSRTLSKKIPISLSSATIRNEMADLEEWGFIEKLTHRQVEYLLKKDIDTMWIIYYPLKSSI